MLPENIHDLIPQAKEYLFSRKDVCFAYLFGGLAKGDPTPLSDVDIAVYLTDGFDPTQSKLEIIEKLVDVYIERIAIQSCAG